MSGKQRGTEVMAVQYPQKLMYFLSSLGCFRTALAIAANTGNMKILELLQQSVKRSHEGQSGHTSMYYSIWPHSAAE